jgi:predicted transcriptional regulator
MYTNIKKSTEKKMPKTISSSTHMSMEVVTKCMNSYSLELMSTNPKKKQLLFTKLVLTQTD